MTGIDVWIAKPGNACRMDDRAWKVSVRDAHDREFTWAAMSYEGRKAPHGHWPSPIPPGTYVVSAVGDGHGDRTDRAIVVVDPGEYARVVLYVAPPEVRQPDRPKHECAVHIRSVMGAGGGKAEVVRVTGTATRCKSVKVYASCGSDEPAKMEVPVSADGTWSALFRSAAKLGCRCGGPITVTARCATDPSCSDVWKGKLECERPEAKPSGSTKDVPR